MSVTAEHRSRADRLGIRNRRSTRFGAGARFGGLAAAIAAAALFAAGGAAAGPVPPLAWAGTATHPYATYSTGRVTVVFPKALPEVDLFQVANSSEGAELVLAHIFELRPNATDPQQPNVVLAASPTDAQQFNGTTAPAGSSSSGAGSFALGLRAQVPVQITGGSRLWSAPNGTFPRAGLASLPRAPIAVNATFSLLPTTASSSAQGLAVGWTVSNWPWVDPHDSLAAEFEFVVFGGTGFVGCTTPALAFAPPPNCTGIPLSLNAILWQSGVRSVQGNDAHGPAAATGWAPTARANTMPVGPVMVGAYYAAPGLARIVVQAPVGGASRVTMTGTFTLLAPVPPVLVSLVRGDPPLYGAALAVFTGAAALGVLAYRRRDRRLRETL